MKARTFFTELKRRRVYTVAVSYLVVAWLVIQVATQVFPFFDVPNWVIRLVVLLIMLGFPVALVISWAFELTPEGLKRTEEVSPNDHNLKWSVRKFAALLISIALLASGLFFFRIAQRSSSAPAAAFPEKSIAVLPFENLSAEKANAYFADGIQDEILTRLSKIADLKVISRTSTQHYESAPENLPEIARQLGVAYILEGSVQKQGDRVHVNV
ncbi:MAG: hypothetical protein ABIR29_07635, partial [Chthoniobacterales bacterium]